MDDPLTVQNIANVALFIAPGYFAIQSYSSVHCKADKDFSRLLVECIALSLPFVGLYNHAFYYISTHWFGVVDPSKIPTTAIKYFLPLIILSTAIGYGWAKLRNVKEVKSVTSKFGMRSPGNDFMELQFRKLKDDEYVTVTLKNGEIFGGVRKGNSTYSKGETQRCYFNFVRWYNKDTGEWDERDGSLIFAMDDVEYMETTSPLPKW